MKINRTQIVSKSVVAVIVLVLVAGGLFVFTIESSKSRGLSANFEQAKELYRNAQYEEAVELFKKVYSTDSKSELGLQSLYFISMGNTALDKTSEAEENWEELNHKDIKGQYSDLVLFNRGLLAERKGNDSEAIGLYNDLLSRYRDSQVADGTLLRLAKLYEKKKQLKEAKETLQEIIEMFPNSEQIGEVQNALGNVNVQLLFSSMVYPGGSAVYEISSGDTINGIASGLGTTVDLIRKCNNIKRDLIHPGQRLKVIDGKFSIVIDKSLNTLILKLNGEFFKLYRVGTGKDNSTPVGSFKINSKIKEPPWHFRGKVIPFGDPDNLLGTRWMGLDKKGYGIHGTWEPDSVGQQSSQGCVRLRNSEVEEIFIIVPIGTPVEIVD
ncbi:MAG: L,D-transpeptidase family protein [Candidatus Theseobacter exili]|nr:L,D-transpeptidase family protein [Candidatus Theseobacter exili]